MWKWVYAWNGWVLIRWFRNLHICRPLKTRFHDLGLVASMYGECIPAVLFPEMHTPALRLQWIFQTCGWHKVWEKDWILDVFLQGKLYMFRDVLWYDQSIKMWCIIIYVCRTSIWYKTRKTGRDCNLFYKKIYSYFAGYCNIERQ